MESLQINSKVNLNRNSLRLVYRLTAAYISALVGIN